MRTWPALLTAAALLAVPAAASAATSKPHFARSYHGTFSGHFESRTGARVVGSDWKVTGVRFRLEHVRQFEGGWTGFYKVTAGTVTFTQTETGPCSYSAKDSFPLAKWLPRPNPSAPLALDKDPSGRLHALGLISVRRTLEVTETCAGSDGSEPYTTEQSLDLPMLFDPAGKAWKPGRRFKGRHTEKDGFDETKRTKSLRWDLKPGR